MRFDQVDFVESELHEENRAVDLCNQTQFLFCFRVDLKSHNKNRIMTLA